MKKRIVSLLLCVLLLCALSIPAFAHTYSKSCNTMIKGDGLDSDMNYYITNGAVVHVMNNGGPGVYVKVDPGATLIFDTKLLVYNSTFDIEGTLEMPSIEDGVTGYSDRNYCEFNILPGGTIIIQDVSIGTGGYHAGTIQADAVTRDGNKMTFHNHKYEEDGKCACGATRTGSILSKGNLWIVLAVLAVGAAVLLVLVKRKKHSAG